jgi:hypothetical protein
METGTLRIRLAALAFALLLNLAAAQTSALSSALYNLCVGVKDLVPVAAMLMITLAAVIYAAGQMMGAETRARANVWATSCLTGALIGLIIATITPQVLNTLQSGISDAC